MDQAATNYSPDYRDALIRVYITLWTNATYTAYHAWQRQDLTGLGHGLNLAIVYLRNVLELMQGWSRLIDRRTWDLEQAGAPRLTDAEIFDACYRELVRRWGPAAG